MTNETFFHFGVTSNPNEAGPGVYQARCIEVDTECHFKGCPKIALNFEITEGEDIGKVAKMFFNNPGKNTGEMGTQTKLYDVVNKLYLEKFNDEGEADLDLKDLFMDEIFTITVVEKKKARGGTTHIVEEIEPRLPF